MSKTMKTVLGIIAVVTIAAAVSYGIYRLLSKKRKPLAVFESNFDEEELLSEEDALDCDDAVGAVDMCMPY